MTDKQLVRLCNASRNISSEIVVLLELAKEIGEESRFEALRIAQPTCLMADANSLLGQFAQEVVPEKI